jgi:hypothetical protein
LDGFSNRRSHEFRQAGRARSHGVERIAAGGDDADAAAATTFECVTTREKLHRLVDELNEAEVEAALVRLERARDALQQWAQGEDPGAVEDEWAQANAREAVREEPW